MGLRDWLFNLFPFLKTGHFGGGETGTHPVPGLAPAELLEAGEYIRALQPQLPTLTAREMQVLWCIRMGYSNEEIAAALQISLATAKTHVHNILVKMNMRSRWELREMLIHLEFGAPPPG